MQLGQNHDAHFVHLNHFGIKIICLLHFPQASAMSFSP
jgi:hypothetical protein